MFLAINGAFILSPASTDQAKLLSPKSRQSERGIAAQRGTVKSIYEKGG